MVSRFVSGGALTGIKDPQNAVTQFTYANGRLTSIADPRHTGTSITATLAIMRSCEETNCKTFAYFGGADWLPAVERGTVERHRLLL